MRRDATWSLAHLKVQIKFANHLGAMRAVDGYSVDGEARSFEGPFCCRLRYDHGGRGDLFYIALTDQDNKSSIVIRAALFQSQGRKMRRRWASSLFFGKVLAVVRAMKTDYYASRTKRYRILSVHQEGLAAHRPGFVLRIQWLSSN